MLPDLATQQKKNKSPDLATQQKKNQVAGARAPAEENILSTLAPNKTAT